MKDMKRCIAIDFDGTICEEGHWPGIGPPIWPVINAAKREQARGAELILWTTRSGESLEEAIKACEGFGLHFDAINGNCQDWVDAWGNDTRKVGCDEFWDDRAFNTTDIIKREASEIEIQNG